MSDRRLIEDYIPIEAISVEAGWWKSICEGRHAVLRRLRCASCL